jgi:hypothetical protein
MANEYWYDGRTFRSVMNSDSGEVSAATVFHYHQQGRIVWAEYSGGELVPGMLLALANANGCLDLRYQHVNSGGELMTGVCRSTPELLLDGRYRLREYWRWTCGSESSVESVIEEVR